MRSAPWRLFASQGIAPQSLVASRDPGLHTAALANRRLYPRLGDQMFCMRHAGGIEGHGRSGLGAAHRREPDPFDDDSALDLGSTNPIADVAASLCLNLTARSERGATLRPERKQPGLSTGLLLQFVSTDRDQRPIVICTSARRLSGSRVPSGRGSAGSDSPLAAVRIEASPTPAATRACFTMSARRADRRSL